MDPAKAKKVAHAIGQWGAENDIGAEALCGLICDVWRAHGEVPGAGLWSATMQIQQIIMDESTAAQHADAIDNAFSRSKEDRFNADTRI